MYKKKDSEGSYVQHSDLLFMFKKKKAQTSQGILSKAA